MDHGAKVFKQINPREHASFLSIISFYFTAPIWKKGKQEDIQQTDIYSVLPKFYSEKLGDKLEARWDVKNRSKSYQKLNNGVKKLSKDNEEENESILKCLIKTFGWNYLGLGIMQLVISTTLIVLQPFALSKFVSYFQLGQTDISKSTAAQYAIFLIVVNLVKCIYNHNYQQLIMEYSITVRTALCSLIYRKALRLNSNASGQFSMGKVVTLITKDVLAIDGALMFLNDVWIGAIQVIVITLILYVKIGPTVFAGIAFFVLMIPVQIYMGRKFSLARLEAAKYTEKRVESVEETITAIKTIKMYTWESYFEKLINLFREEEIKKLKIIYYLKSSIMVLGGVTIKIAFFLLILVYSLLGKTARADTISFAHQSFFLLRSCITTSIPMGIGHLAELWASLKRIQRFLNAPEYERPEYLEGPIVDPRICLDKVAVKIGNTSVLKSVSLDHEDGLLIVTGHFGSGKSSLLKTILNEYPLSGGEIFIRGTISYAPEEPWLFPSTIKQNILFGEKYNEKRYKEVLRVCALTKDLNYFKQSDLTLVGDKGVNLSKGQQARICLARAIYRETDIYLLDDCLSALDSPVNKHVFKECIRGFLKEKLVVMISNNIYNISQVPTSKILFMENGKTLDLDQQKAALDRRITYYIDEDTPYDFDSDEEETDPTENDKLLTKQNLLVEGKTQNLYQETNKQGSVLWKNYTTYYKFTGGIYILVFLLLLFLICQAATSATDKLISKWITSQGKLINLAIHNETNSPAYDEASKANNRLIKLYVILMLVAVSFTFARSFSTFYFCAQAGRKLHNILVKGLVNACMSFYDSLYIGNIINRVSKDFHTVDEVIPFKIYENLRLSFAVIASIALIVVVNFYLIIPCAVLLVLLFIIQRYYMPTGRSLKRLDAATRSPMVGYVSASLEGLTTVHALKEEIILQKEFDKHQDLFTSAFYMGQSVDRAFAFTIDFLVSILLATIILIILMFPKKITAGDANLAYSQGFMLMGMLQWAIRQATEMETTMTSVERILEYADATPENKEGAEWRDWPNSGRILYENVSLTYKSNREKVLNNISFSLGAKSKIGIVGRTGAGKSSLISTLFRLYEYDGLISIDGVNIQSLPLKYLRSNIGIIPQDPILFRGTIRSNIDPLKQYSDDAIWQAIEKVQIKSMIPCLDKEITDKGTSYSSGQRQLICLVRALISRNKIIVLDEATANIDAETDMLLQKTLQDHFTDCTVLTIAHRLQSFHDVDMILVVDKGEIVQIDSPNELLTDKNGLFYKMMREAGEFSLL